MDNNNYKIILITNQSSYTHTHVQKKSGCVKYLRSYIG